MRVFKQAPNYKIDQATETEERLERQKARLSLFADRLRCNPLLVNSSHASTRKANLVSSTWSVSALLPMADTRAGSGMCH